MFVNLIAFNFLWFGLVYWGNSFALIAVLALALHLRFYCKGKQELWLIIIVTSIGIFVDSMLSYLQVFIFTSTQLIPLWLAILWACFAATILHSLHFLAISKLLQVVMGAVFGPLSYIAGEKMGAVQFGYSLTFTSLILAITWTLLLLAFYYLAQALSDKELAHA